MLRAELQTTETLSKERYIQLHMAAFGKWEEHEPSCVHLWYDEDDLVAFTTIRITTPTTLYLQFIGMAAEVEKSRTKKMAYYMEIIKALKGMGFKYIAGFVENTNTKAIFWALRVGFRITGLRSRGAAPVLLEIILEV